MRSAWVKTPDFGPYLKRLGLEDKAAAGSALPAREMTDEEIIAKAETALRYWQEHPHSMGRRTIH